MYYGDVRPCRGKTGLLDYNDISPPLLFLQSSKGALSHCR